MVAFYSIKSIICRVVPRVRKGRVQRLLSYLSQWENNSVTENKVLPDINLETMCKRWVSKYDIRGIQGIICPYMVHFNDQVHQFFFVQTFHFPVTMTNYTFLFLGKMSWLCRRALSKTLLIPILFIQKKLEQKKKKKTHKHPKRKKDGRACCVMALKKQTRLYILGQNWYYFVSILCVNCCLTMYCEFLFDLQRKRLFLYMT